MNILCKLKFILVDWHKLYFGQKKIYGVQLITKKKSRHEGAIEIFIKKYNIVWICITYLGLNMGNDFSVEHNLLTEFWQNKKNSDAKSEVEHGFKSDESAHPKERECNDKTATRNSPATSGRKRAICTHQSGRHYPRREPMPSDGMVGNDQKKKLDKKRDIIKTVSVIKAALDKIKYGVVYFSIWTENVQRTSLNPYALFCIAPSVLTFPNLGNWEDNLLRSGAKNGLMKIWKIDPDVSQSRSVKPKKKKKKEYNCKQQKIRNKKKKMSVDINIIEKLSVEPPTREAVIARLKEIAKEFDVEWEPNTLEQEESMPAIIGHRNEVVLFSDFIV
ncbi:hypothetical protein RFI_06648, partial [Reticulomyxa filosa]